MTRLSSLLSGSASPLAIIGAGLFWLWMDAAVFSSTLVTGAAMGDAYEMCFVTITFASVGMLALLVMRPLRDALFSSRRQLMTILSAAVGVGGGILVVLSGSMGNAAVLVTGAVLMGLCFGVLNVMWGCIAVAQGYERAIVHISGAWALGLPCNLLIYALPAWLSGWIVAALPLLSACCFLVLAACQGTPSLRIIPQEGALPRVARSRRMVAGVDARLIALILTFCTVFGLMYVYRALSPTLALQGMGIEVVGVRGLTALAFFVAFLTIFRRRIRLLFKTCSFMLVVGLAVMVVGLFSPGFYAASGVMIAVGYCGFDVLVWTMIAFHGHFPDNRMPRVVVMTMLGEQLGIGIGAVLGIAMTSLAWSSSVTTGVMMGLNILAVGVLVGFTEYGSRLWALLTRAEAESGASGSGLPSGETVQRAELGAEWEGMIETGTLRARVASFSERYRLTEREQEILAIYAQGRSMAYIATKFCVSENTVKTHVRHIYAKCGAHNKQELLDLVESC